MFAFESDDRAAPSLQWHAPNCFLPSTPPPSSPALPPPNTPTLLLALQVAGLRAVLHGLGVDAASTENLPSLRCRPHASHIRRPCVLLPFRMPFACAMCLKRMWHGRPACLTARWHGDGAAASNACRCLPRCSAPAGTGGCPARSSLHDAPWAHAGQAARCDVGGKCCCLPVGPTPQPTSLLVRADGITHNTCRFEVLDSRRPIRGSPGDQTGTMRPRTAGEMTEALKVLGIQADEVRGRRRYSGGTAQGGGAVQQRMVLRPAAGDGREGGRTVGREGAVATQVAAWRQLVERFTCPGWDGLGWVAGWPAAGPRGAG